MGRVLVTGSQGFIGRVLCDRLTELDHIVTGVSRRGSSSQNQSIGDIAAFQDWHPLLAGIDVIVHLAARAHVLRESARDSIEEFRRINVRPTERLARAAVVAGVKRLVFVSSIGVNGVATSECPFSETDVPDPAESYAISKSEAEQCLRDVEGSSNLEVTVIRPPLVYGPGVKGNFLRLLNLVNARVPIPLGAVRNRRSFLGLQNLCDLLAICVFHPAAGGETFVAADGEDVSTPNLLRTIAQAMGRRLRMPTIPLGPLRLLATLTGRSADLERLTRSLQIDASRAHAIVGWRPERTLQEGIGEMTDWYLKREIR